MSFLTCRDANKRRALGARVWCWGSVCPHRSQHVAHYKSLGFCCFHGELKFTLKSSHHWNSAQKYPNSRWKVPKLSLKRVSVMVKRRELHQWQRDERCFSGKETRDASIWYGMDLVANKLWLAADANDANSLLSMRWTSSHSLEYNLAWFHSKS